MIDLLSEIVGFLFKLIAWYLFGYGCALFVFLGLILAFLVAIFAVAAVVA